MRLAFRAGQLQSSLVLRVPGGGQRRAMAWTCHGTSNDTLVKALTDAKLVTDERAIEAMQAVDRKLFSKDKELAYQDQPHHIGYNATISAPHMHASCLDIMKEHLQPGNKVLDVGSGSGYLTAVMSYMVRSNGDKAQNSQGGKAVGIEHIPELKQASEEAAHHIPFAHDMIEDGSLQFITGDGLQGYPECAPYDAIHVGASASEIPQPLVEQLALGGRMVLPVGPTGDSQDLIVIDKDQNGKCFETKLFGVMYVPLTSRQVQLGLAN